MISWDLLKNVKFKIDFEKFIGFRCSPGKYTVLKSGPVFYELNSSLGKVEAQMSICGSIASISSSFEMDAQFCWASLSAQQNTTSLLIDSYANQFQKIRIKKLLGSFLRLILPACFFLLPSFYLNLRKNFRTEYSPQNHEAIMKERPRDNILGHDQQLNQCQEPSIFHQTSRYLQWIQSWLI